ncbi:MAG: diguanylate cyclase, partial [Oscillospiraceae bacterium]
MHSIGCVRNIDEMKGKELLLQEKAERDLLTGLYNKVTAQLLIENATHFTAEKPIDGAFLLIDVDNFKHVNDTLGHAGGDEVLVKVAAGLLALFRTG